MQVSTHLAIDAVAVVVANLIQLALVVLFLARAHGRLRLERGAGRSLVVLALPLGVVAAYNALAGRPWWTLALPGLMVLFLAVELLLDDILKIEFRQGRLLVPYLLLFYLALVGMIGYAFSVGEAFGFLTLIGYFAQLAASAYAYRRVGHGPPRHAATTAVGRRRAT